METYAVTRHTVTNISTIISSLMKKAESANVSMKAKRVREAQFPELESGIMTFISLARSAKMSVTHGILSAKTIGLRDELLLLDTTLSQAYALSKFSASRG